MRLLVLLAVLGTATAQPGQIPQSRNLGCALVGIIPCLYHNCQCEVFLDNFVTPEDVEFCAHQCELYPGNRVVPGNEEYEYECTCLWNDDTLCVSDKDYPYPRQALTMPLNNTKMLSNSKVANQNLELMGVHITYKHLGIEPMVCTHPDGCGAIPYHCDVGPCYSDECYFEGFCYRVERRVNVNYNCTRGKPAAIASKREHDHFSDIAKNAWSAFMSYQRIFTGGLVKAGTTEFLWDQWPEVPSDSVYEFFPGLKITQQDYDQALYVGARVYADRTEITHQLSSFDFAYNNEWTLCKTEVTGTNRQLAVKGTYKMNQNTVNPQKAPSVKTIKAAI